MKKSKKILITGINGFIGSNCAKYFSDKGAEVFGIDLLGDKTLSFIKGEVNLDNLKSFNQKFDVIIHLAGSGTVGLAQQNPKLDHQKTVGSTENLLEYMKDFNREAKLIYSSSAAVYGDSYEAPIKETDALNPISVYGKHKVDVEEMCKEHHQKFGLNINVIRFFSIYGEGLKKQLLWDFCNRTINNLNAENLPCFGTGEEKRDFIHINDAIELIELLIQNGESFELINGGTNLQTSVLQVLNSICRELNFTGRLVFDNIIKEGDPKVLVANIDNALSIGFNPKTTIEEGLKKYVEWFKGIN